MYLKQMSIRGRAAVAKSICAVLLSFALTLPVQAAGVDPGRVEPDRQSRAELDVPHESLRTRNVPAPIPPVAEEDEMVEDAPEGVWSRLAQAIKLWLFGPDPEIEQEMRCFSDRYGGKTCKLVDVYKLN